MIPLFWRPWYVDELSRVEQLAWFWPAIQLRCAIDDPAEFPALDFEWSEDDKLLFGRYVIVASRLVKTQFFNEDASVSVDLMTNTVREQIRPPDDATAGFIASFRQLFRHNEEASFDGVLRRLRACAQTAGAEDAQAALRTWRDAHRVLLAQPLESLMHDVLVDCGHDVGDRRPSQRPLAPEDITPKELITVFLNGDLMHWGEGRERIAEWQKNEVDLALMDSHMRSDAAMLAHFYVGFAGVLRVICPELAAAADLLEMIADKLHRRVAIV